MSYPYPGPSDQPWQRNLSAEGDDDEQRRRQADGVDGGEAAAESGGCTDSCDLGCNDGCELPSCGCDLMRLAPLLLLLRVVPGAFRASAVDPYVDPPAGRLARVAARLIRSYQLHVSVPRARPVCTMTPTCSRYGLQALSRHGLWTGGLLVVRRLRRCGSSSGADPVPARGVERRSHARM
ncbi:membrane protein insertion efficiency factor YidD [Nocardioides sp. C4-1]|uniref:membrane protein insertion efficiency factor YidD n=1 Tax=Nocardioides sp. C4-1 TaxID=3151851 RepID=UPI0032631066